MHEFGIVEPLLKAALEAAEVKGGLPIQEVRVSYGRLRQVVPEALTFAFEALTKGTLAEGATLVWEEIPPRVRCQACEAIFQPADDWVWICPKCAATGGELLEGNELLLQSVTLNQALAAHERTTTQEIARESHGSALFRKPGRP
jgi:hydrogenase nickel incorporation protein HypA/HybF